jgi:hypothetical protein
LSDANTIFIRKICNLLSIESNITSSSDYDIISGKSERLVDLCRQAGAKTYLSGPAARDYLDVALFADAGIGVEFMDYEGYRPYNQPHPPFAHAVSIVDLILCTGPDARSYLKIASKR